MSELAELKKLRAQLRWEKLPAAAATTQANIVAAYMDWYEQSIGPGDAAEDDAELPFMRWLELLADDLSRRHCLPCMEAHLISWMHFQMNAWSPDGGGCYYAPISLLRGEELSPVAVHKGSGAARSILCYYRHMLSEESAFYSPTVRRAE